MLRIAVLASGRGSNLKALIDAIACGEIDGRIVSVFSDRSDSGALVHARDAGLVARYLDPKAYASRLDFDRALFEAVDASGAELIVCAGFLRILSAEVVTPRVHRMINLHPSLLPKYPGLNTHRRVLESGDREHGASVHVLIPALDAGPVIAQTRIAIAPGDDPETLAARLRPREHRLLVQVVRWCSERRLRFDAERVYFDQRLLTEPLQVE